MDAYYNITTHKPNEPTLIISQKKVFLMTQFWPLQYSQYIFFVDLLSKKVLTWLSLSPSFSASFFLSGLLMYFCIWNLLSNPFLCRSLNTARRIIPLLGFPRPLWAHGKVPGKGKTAVWAPETGVETTRDERSFSLVSEVWVELTHLLDKAVVCSD